MHVIFSWSIFGTKRTRFIKNLLGLCYMHRKTLFRGKLINKVCVISASVVLQCTITLFLMTLTLLTSSSNNFFSYQSSLFTAITNLIKWSKSHLVYFIQINKRSAMPLKKVPKWLWEHVLSVLYSSNKKNIFIDYFNFGLHFFSFCKQNIYRWMMPQK